MDQHGCVTTVVVLSPVDTAASAGPGQDLLGAPPVLLQRLTLPGKDGNTLQVIGGVVRPTTDCSDHPFETGDARVGISRIFPTSTQRSRGQRTMTLAATPG